MTQTGPPRFVSVLRSAFAPLRAPVRQTSAEACRARRTVPRAGPAPRSSPRSVDKLPPPACPSRRTAPQSARAGPGGRAEGLLSPRPQQPVQERKSPSLSPQEECLARFPRGNPSRSCALPSREHWRYCRPGVSALRASP
eukprot:908478-Rhodomonas_salina.1